MRKFQCLLFVLKPSFICYYIICMTVTFNFGSRVNVLWKTMLRIRLTTDKQHRTRIRHTRKLKIQDDWMTALHLLVNT